MTHFATADEKEGITKQLDCFNRVTNNYNFSSSVANSAALYKFPEARLDWVRPGILLYGASPFEDISAKEIEVKPVMSLVSKIIAIQDIKKGQAVGYGSNFIAKNDMRIGIVACGYGDGYPRHAKTGTPIFVHDKTTKIVGRVSMDMLYVDLSKIEKAVIGSKVEMWGNHISVDEVAKNSGTSGTNYYVIYPPQVVFHWIIYRWPKVKQHISAENVAELHLNGKDSAHIVLFGIHLMRQLLNQRHLQGLLHYQRLMSLQS